MISLPVASVIAVVTIVIGLALVGSSNWHFTILDTVVDVVAGVVFGLLAYALTAYVTRSRTGIQVGVAGLIVVVGIVTVLIVEGGAARALIFGT